VTKHTRTYNEHWQKEGRPRPDEQEIIRSRNFSIQTTSRNSKKANRLPK
jgi:hypothetical protein